MIKNYLMFIRESVYDEIDPYGEDEWGKEDIYIINVIGQDMNFLAKRITEEKSIRLSNDHIFQYNERHFVIAEINDNGDIHFNGGYTADSNTAYPVPEEDVIKILDGEKIVGYIKWPNLIRVNSIQNLCANIGCEVRDIKFYNYRN